MFDKDSTLAQMVIEAPKAAEVLGRFGLDYCCHGGQTLIEACSASGVDVGAVRDELARIHSDEIPAVNWTAREPSEIIDFILERYHEPLRRDLPEIVALARKVERVHAEKATCPRGLADHLAQVGSAVDDHLMKEEQILFPAIRSGADFPVLMPIRMMMQEHEDHGQNLARTREITKGFAVPEEACATWRELYRRLEALESELMQHIHLENHVLFPKAVEEAGARFA